MIYQYPMSTDIGSLLATLTKNNRWKTNAKQRCLTRSHCLDRSKDDTMCIFYQRRTISERSSRSFSQRRFPLTVMYVPSTITSVLQQNMSRVYCRSLFWLVHSVWLHANSLSNLRCRKPHPTFKSNSPFSSLIFESKSGYFYRKLEVCPCRPPPA